MRAIPISEVTQVAEGRRAAAERATALGFDETNAGRVAIVATELATNLVKHGGGGELLVGSYEDSTGSGIELIALDKGRGISNVEACLQDGYSSAGTRGDGLGAVRRQSQVMEVASWPSLGTAVLARLDSKSRPRGAPAPWGGVSVPMPGETVCGDSWAAADSENGRVILVADGLGHGPQAAVAAAEAVRLFREHQSRPVPEILDLLHNGLRATRGAAIAVARFDRGRNKLVYGGIGNIAGMVVQGNEMRRMVSLSGTAGHNARKIQAFDYQYTDGVVVLASDGIASGMSLQRYPGLSQLHPTLIAAVLYRDFARRRDDATVLVARGVTP